MDSVKNQLRFFKILVIVLSVFVLAQCTFWLSSFTNNSCSQYDPMQKVKALQQPRVIAPAVSAVFQFISNINSAE